jgi:hypothetical protein
MMAREKQAGFGGGRPPTPRGSWLVGLVVGMTVSNLAAGAIMLGTGAAIGKAITGGPPLTSRRRPSR